MMWVWFHRRTVSDKIAGKEIVLTDKDIDLIERIQNSQYPDDSYDPYTVGGNKAIILISNQADFCHSRMRMFTRTRKQSIP